MNIADSLPLDTAPALGLNYALVLNMVEALRFNPKANQALTEGTHLKHVGEVLVCFREVYLVRNRCRHFLLETSSQQGVEINFEAKVYFNRLLKYFDRPVEIFR